GPPSRRSSDWCGALTEAPGGGCRSACIRAASSVGAKGSRPHVQACSPSGLRLEPGETDKKDADMLDLSFDAPKPKVIAGAKGDWELVIGMEIHAQISTQGKLFSGASTTFGAEPNSNVA